MILHKKEACSIIFDLEYPKFTHDSEQYSSNLRQHAKWVSQPFQNKCKVINPQGFPANSKSR